jgi:hypothetical protein
VAFYGKAVLFGDLILKLFDTRILEFDDLTAPDADQMIMMLVMIAGFVTCLTITKMSLFGNPALGEKFQAAVNRRITNPGVLLAQAKIELFRRKMRTGAQELFENNFPLARRLQPLRQEVISELVFGFAVTHKTHLIENGFQIKQEVRKCQEECLGLRAETTETGCS